MKRDSSAGLQATQWMGCVCAEGKQESQSEGRITTRGALLRRHRRPLTIVCSNERLLTEIPHFNSMGRKI